jgi:hypothetical protein
VGLVALGALAAFSLAAIRMGRAVGDSGTAWSAAAVLALAALHFGAILSSGARAPATAVLAAAHAAALGTLLAVATARGWLKLGLLAVGTSAFAVLVFATLHARPDEWPARLGLAAAIYVVFLAWPFAAGQAAVGSREPWLAAILASAPFFFAARQALLAGGYKHVIGALPLAQAAAMALLLRRLLAVEPARGRDTGRLALVAGAALAFVTVAIPLQLEKQWITIGWALEGAALAWLYRRIAHRGLLLTSAGLLGAAFVRLALNPEIFHYTPRSEVPIFNWYLYTYLVCAAALVVAGWLLRHADDSLAAALPRLSTAAFTGAGVLLFLLLNIEIADFYAEGPTVAFSFGARLEQDLTYTIGWLVFGLGLLAVGIVARSRGARLAALALVAVTGLQGLPLRPLAPGRALSGGLVRGARGRTLARGARAPEVRARRVQGKGVNRRRTGLVVVAGAAALAALPSGAAVQGLGSFRFERSAVLQGSGPQRLPVDVPLLVGSAPFRVESWPGPMGSGRAASRAEGCATCASTMPRAARCPTCWWSRPTREPEWRRAARPAADPGDEEAERLRGGPRRATSVDRIHLKGIPAPFLKRLSLDGSGDRARWTRLAPEATLFDLPDSGLRQLELAFAPGLYRYLRITWDDASSARVAGAARALARGRRAPTRRRPVVTTPLAFDRRASEPGTSRFRVRCRAPPADRGPAPVRRAAGTSRAKPASARRAWPAWRPLPSASARRGSSAPSATSSPPTSCGSRSRLRRPRSSSSRSTTATIRRSTCSPSRRSWPSCPSSTWRARRAGRSSRAGGNWRSTRPATTSSRPARAPRARPRASAPGARRIRRRPNRKRWGLAASLPGVGPSLETSPFRYARTLPDGPAGLVAVPLDAAVLAHSEGRLSGSFADRARRRLARAPAAVPARPPAGAARGGPSASCSRGGGRGTLFPARTSVYRLTLPYAELPPARLVLRTSARVFQREVQLLIEPLPDEPRKRKADAPRLVASASWRHADPDSEAPALTIALPTLPRAELLLAVAEGDNSALPVAAPELLLPSWHVRLFRPGPDELRVVYGNRALAAPRYDLSLLAPSVLASPARETALAGEQARAPSETEVLRPRAFWALMLGAVLVLLGLIVHLVRGARVAEGIEEERR